MLDRSSIADRAYRVSRSGFGSRLSSRVSRLASRVSRLASVMRASVVSVRLVRASARLLGLNLRKCGRGGAADRTEAEEYKKNWESTIALQLSRAVVVCLTPPSSLGAVCSRGTLTFITPLISNPPLFSSLVITVSYSRLTTRKGIYGTVYCVHLIE